jgi:plasmid stability protein
VSRLAPMWRQWRYFGAMPAIQIKDVPEETHRVLRRRAAEAGQSLQEYLRTGLIEQASRPTMAEWVAEVESHAEGLSLTFDEANRLIREDRDRR